MATCVLSDDGLERLRGAPEINKEELTRLFTLLPHVRFIAPASHRPLHSTHTQGRAR